MANNFQMKMNGKENMLMLSHILITDSKQIPKYIIKHQFSINYCKQKQ